MSSMNIMKVDTKKWVVEFDAIEAELRVEPGAFENVFLTLYNSSGVAFAGKRFDSFEQALTHCWHFHMKGHWRKPGGKQWPWLNLRVKDAKGNHPTYKFD